MTRSRQMPAEMLAIYVPQIVQNMISERAMAYEAGRLGLKISSDETDNAILDSLPADFVKNGKVDAETLNALLQQQGATMADLKSDTSRQLLVNRLRQVVAEGVVITPSEVEAEYRKRNDKVKVEYAVMPQDKYRAEAEPSDAEMKAFYDGHKSVFTIPEKRSLAIIVMDMQHLTASKPIVEADLQREYNANQDRYRTPERVNVRHILIKSDATNDAAMKAKAEGILKQLQGGADFAKLAKSDSQDPGSGVNGGELGWIVKGQTVPEFEKSAFSLPIGQTSGLVKTSYGYHILQVSQHEQAHIQPFDEVKMQIAREVIGRQASQDIQKLADKVVAELRKDPAHPEKAAAAAGTPVIHADNVQTGDPIPGIGISKDFNDAIAPLRKGEVTAGPVPIEGNRLAVAAVTDFVGAHPATFDEAKGDVRTKAGQDKLLAVLQKKASELAAKAQANGGDLARAAKEMGIELKTSPDVDRNGAIEGVGQASSLHDAFAKPVNTVFGPVQTTGGPVVVKVAAKTPADPAAMGAQTSAIRTELKQQKERDRAQMFEAGLKKRLEQEGKLKVHQDVVNRLVKSYSTRS
jgi:peptidyl-prolyl cis-trans isomerase D